VDGCGMCAVEGVHRCGCLGCGTGGGLWDGLCEGRSMAGVLCLCWCFCRGWWWPGSMGGKVCGRLCWCVYMSPAAVPWVCGGVFWFVAMAWRGVFVLVAWCVAGGGVRDELGLCGVVFVTLSGSSVRTTPSPIGKYRGLFMVCSVPWLAPCMYGCLSLCFCVNARSETCKSLHAVWGPSLMPVYVGFSLFPCTHLQDASKYLHLAHLIIV